MAALSESAPRAARVSTLRDLLLCPIRVGPSPAELTVTRHEDVIRCEGVQLSGVVWDEEPSPPAPHRAPPTLQDHQFRPHASAITVQMETALDTALQLVGGHAGDGELRVRGDEELCAALHAASAPALRLRGVADTERALLQVARDVLKHAQKTKELIESLDRESFALVIESEPLGDTIPMAVEAAGGVVAAVWRGVWGALMLLRRAVPPVQPTVVPVKGAWMSLVRAALANTERRVLIVAEQQPAQTVLPVWRALLKESGAAAARLDVLVVEDGAPRFTLGDEPYAAQLRRRLRCNVYSQGEWGAWYTSSVATCEPHLHATLEARGVGDLDSLAWLQAPAPTAPTVRVAFTAISTRDSQQALQKREAPLGQDFSGIMPSGERVMGVMAAGALATEVALAGGALLWPVPAHWSLEDAATVPLPYVHAYYVLLRALSWRPGCRVLVAGGGGALAQALLSVCLHHRCEVFAAVANTQRKLELLRAHPTLKGENVGSSRDGSFEETVAVRSGGAMCEVVVLAAGGRRQREAAMHCVGFEGWLLDVTTRGAKRGAPFGMQYLQCERNYRSVKLDALFVPDNQRERNLLRTCVSEGIARGAVRPLPRVTFPAQQAVRAARFAGAARCAARVLLSVPQDKLTAEPRLWCGGETWGVLTATGGSAAALALRLAARGVRRLLVYCAQSSPLLTITARRCRSLGVSVELVQSAAALTADAELHGVVLCGDPTSVAAMLPDLERATHRSQELRHFMVVVTEISDAETAAAAGKVAAQCRRRRSAGLPATYLDCSQNSWEWLSALDLAHSCGGPARALLSSPRAASLNPRDRLQRIIGAPLSSLDGSLPLSALQLGTGTLDELRGALQQLTSRAITSHTLLRTTIYQLEEWCCTEEGVQQEDEEEGEEEGLSAFVASVEEDECLATEPVVALDTALVSYTSHCKEEEVQSSAPHVILIPGLGGDRAGFEVLAQMLRARAIVAQLPPNLPATSLRDIASHVHESVRTRVSLRSPFYLVGHSFGALVALELAAILEEQGLEGVVVCVDSSPLAMRAQLAARLGAGVLQDDAALQDRVCGHLYRLMGGRDPAALSHHLQRANDWGAKTDACVALLRGRARYSQQYQRERLTATLARVVLARDHRLDQRRLRSRVVLLRAKPHPNQVALPEDYGLGAQTEKPIEVVQLVARHAEALRDVRAAAAINSCLDDALQAEYRDRDDCHVYLADPLPIL